MQGKQKTERLLLYFVVVLKLMRWVKVFVDDWFYMFQYKIECRRNDLKKYISFVIIVRSVTLFRSKYRVLFQNKGVKYNKVFTTTKKSNFGNDLYRKNFVPYLHTFLFKCLRNAVKTASTICFVLLFI